MADKIEKVMVLGIDSPIASRVYRFAQEGKLPTIQKLMEDGVHAPNCLVPYPTITPPNWTSIATGATPGTHGITDFDGHIPGDPLDEVHQCLDAREVEAEAIWTAAESAGKKSIIISWPTSWPTLPKDGFRISGFGNNINDWRINVPRSVFTQYNLTHDILITNGPFPFGSEVVWQKAQGWEGVEHSGKAKEAAVSLVMRRSQYKLAPITWYLLVDSTDGKGYDTVQVARSKKKVDVFARLRVGEWTPNLYDTVQTDAGPKPAVFRMKMLELSPDAEELRIFIPGLCGLTGWGAPDEIEQEITSEKGMPMGRAGWESYLMEWIDEATLLETCEFTHEWLADAALYLLKNKPWDLYFMHIHTIDWFYHTFSVDVDPATSQNPEMMARAEKIEVALYQGMDRCLGRILEAADERTLVLVISDHGAKATMHHFSVQDVLERAGLLVYQPAEEGKARRIDWSKTKAVGQRHIHVYVNLKGRDPLGIVEPGEEYHQVVQQVLDALHEYRDPKTGLHPITLALTREDARNIGLDHPTKAGDVIYAVDPRFGKEHGEFLPTARVSIGDMRGLFVMAGPGVKHGDVLKRTVHLTDIVPTICHLAELPVPAHCEGGILYQALEDPNGKTKELQSLRRNVDRLKRMVERPPMC